MRCVLKCVPKLPTGMKLLPPVRNFAKLLRKENVVPINSETLTGRILLYLNADKLKPLNAVSEISNVTQVNEAALRKLSTDDFLVYLKSLDAQPKNDVLPKFHLIDLELNLRVAYLAPANIFKLLNLYMSIIPNRLTETKFYKRSIQNLHSTYRLKLEKNDFLQLFFYVGLMKKTPQAQAILRECLNLMDETFISNLTIEELCIICNSTFKTSTKITKTALLDKVKTCLNDNLFLLKDSALFVTLVKTIRHNRYQDDDLLSTISCAVFFNKSLDLYSFSTMCHILALYADYFYYDEKLVVTFARNCLGELERASVFGSKHTYMEEQLRGKDIKRFLWVLGMFSEFKLVSKEELEKIVVPKLVERIKSGEFGGDIGSLVDMFLYLWMLDYHPYELVPYIFKPKNTKALGDKTLSHIRLNLLLYAINVENADLYSNLLVEPCYHSNSNYFAQFQIRKRGSLKRILNELKRITPELKLSKFEFSSEVPFLNVVGITGLKKNGEKAVYIELLDDYTRIKNVDDDVPVGLMALKLRLLDKSSEGLLVVSQQEIDDMTEEELREYLLDEIKLIC